MAEPKTPKEWVRSVFGPAGGIDGHDRSEMVAMVCDAMAQARAEALEEMVQKGVEHLCAECNSPLYLDYLRRQIESQRAIAPQTRGDIPPGTITAHVPNVRNPEAKGTPYKIPGGPGDWIPGSEDEQRALATRALGDPRSVTVEHYGLCEVCEEHHLDQKANCPKCDSPKDTRAMVDDEAKPAHPEALGEYENEMIAHRVCSLAGPGRGDCEHFVGLPGKSIPGMHDGPDDTIDHYGKPNGWCAPCWLTRQLSTVTADLRQMKIEAAQMVHGAVEIRGCDGCPHLPTVEPRATVDVKRCASCSHEWTDDTLWCPKCRLANVDNGDSDG